MLVEVYHSSPEGSDGAVYWFAIYPLMDTYPFPPIFLVVELKRCTVGG